MGDKTGRTELSASAITAYLRLIADSKWVSKRALQLWLSSNNWRSRVIQKMKDDGYITCMNINEKSREKRRKGRQKKKQSGDGCAQESNEVPTYVYGKRYALTKQGREFLSEYNEARYGPGEDLALATNEYGLRRVYRLSLLSEMRAMSELAGYCVHPHTKPPIAVVSNHPVPPAGRPAFTAFRATEIPERFHGYESSVHNQETFQYHETNLRTKYGYEYRDLKNYMRRETPVGCIYTLPEILELAEKESEYDGQGVKNIDRLHYTRMSGLLFTGHGSYRIFNTERTAPKIRGNGEGSIVSILNAWSQEVYKRSLRILVDDGNGNPVEEQIIPKLKGAILFGDHTHQAAISVLRQSYKEGLMFGGAKKKVQASQNYNLRSIPNTFFLPVIQEAVPLYSMMLFPHWTSWVKLMGLEYLGTLAAERSEAPALLREHIGDDVENGSLSDGSWMITFAALHLDTVLWMITRLSGSEDRFTIMAMEWQKPFFDGLLEEIRPDDVARLTLHYIPQGFLEDFARNLHEKQGNPYDR